MQDFERCNLCARHCLVDRTKGQIGYCGASDKMHICRTALHKWEEPIISGKNGSGTIFFSGCSLKCVFCQNSKISLREVGEEFTPSQLAEKMLQLQNQGAHNINFVTPTHYAPLVAKTIITAKQNGLAVPIVYNTSSYDNVETLKMLSGLVDIYLPDLKYIDKRLSEKYSFAKDYADIAKKAIEEMVRQQPRIEFNKDGMLESGVVVRVLLLPGHVANSKLAVKYLYESFGDDIYISLMSQYTPIGKQQPPLNRCVTNKEYSELLDYAVSLGVKNAFIQERGSASESFIPDFQE